MDNFVYSRVQYNSNTVIEPRSMHEQETEDQIITHVNMKKN